MSRLTHLSIFSFLLFLLVVLSSLENAVVSAAPMESVTPTFEYKVTRTPMGTPTGTATPGLQMGARPQAWIDGSIDLDQFLPEGALIVHFNTPMSPESSPRPVLSWPNTEGVSSWNSTFSTLTFTPSSPLNSKTGYTIFLDPGLRSANGDVLTNAPEWNVHIKKGTGILSVSPAPGASESRIHTIEVQFDRGMNPSISKSTLLIAPDVPFTLKWKDRNTLLEIILQQPLEPDQRYDLTFKGGNHEDALYAADGSYLAEDYRWFYWQKPLVAKVSTLGERSISINFNYALSKDKTGTPFTITPSLAGEWKWSSSRELLFIAKDPIPASNFFELNLHDALVDANGFQISDLPTILFSGIPPIHLANQNITQYEKSLFADPGLEAIRIEFDIPVNHTSVENAFSIHPQVRGKLKWEKGTGDSKEVLVYTLDELLKLSTTYTARIDPTAMDRDGHILTSQPYEVTFLTNQWADLSPSFGEYGSNIQVVNADGPRRIQFAGVEDETSFAAYHFDLMDFARLYADHYHERRYGSNVLDIPIPSDLEATAVWKNISTRQAEDGSVIETTLPVELPAGLYVINMRNRNVLYDQMFLVVTHNTLVVKSNGEDVFIWLTDINGGNVTDAEVRIYSTTGEKIREGKTDENGQYRVTIPAGSEPMLVSARVDHSGLAGDVALAGFDSGWYSSYPYSHYDNSDLLPNGQPYLVYTYTERPIYRPGQTVNFKSIIRKDSDVRYSLPEEGTPVKVKILDARENALETLDLLTNRYGSVNGLFQIGEGALLGDYQIETEVDGVTTYQTFKVEDYRKPDYQVKLTSLQPEKQDRFVRGEKVTVKVNTSYYFGEPLARAKLDVHFYDYWPTDVSVSGPFVTDENGEATLTFLAPYDPDNSPYYWGDESHPYRMRMEVAVNDGSNQMVSGSYWFTVYPAAKQLELKTDDYYVQPNEVFSVMARSTDLFGKPIAGANLTLTTTMWNRETYDFTIAGQRISLQTGADGTARQDLKLGPGYHRLTLYGEDAQGHQLHVNRWIYVFRSKQDWFERSRDEFLMVSAGKESYKPYEKAQLAIESTFSGPALLTFERGSVINTKMVELTAPLTIVETDIIPEYAPNVYITVNAWQAGSKEIGRYRSYYSYESSADSYLRLARTQIQVDSTAKALNIDITTDKKTYAPGEKLNALIQVKDAAGNPVSAELSLAVVDESIFALADDPSGDIFNAFYGPRAHSVNTYDSMSPYRVIMESGGCGGGGGGENPPAVRSEFPDTSAWYPVIETDANGQAQVSIDLPDNTTSWRLTVKAVSLNHQVGQAITNVETKKEVFVRPVMPRVLTDGDQATLTAFVHNYSGQVQTVSVNLSAPGLELSSPNDEKITLQPGEVSPVGWRVRVQSAKPTQVTITAKDDAGILDSIRLPLPLQPAAVQEVQNQSGQFTGTLALALPLPDIEKETSEVRLTLNRSMSGTLLNGLEYLTGYPYGCVEQTMSRALPNAVVGRAAVNLGVGGPERQAQLDPLIKASIQRLYGLQHGDGGWGWWTDDVSDPYQTAWVLFGLGVTDDSGYAIEPKVMDRAAQWLQDEMSHNDGLDARTRAYALYSMAMAGRGDLKKTQTLSSESLYELDPFSQAALALSLNRLGDQGNARKILDLLSDSALKQDEYVYWPQPSYDGTYHSKTMASSVRTTALVLQAFAEIEPESQLLPGIVKYLADQRQGIYGWGTTNETSYTILALTEYLVNQENETGTTPYEVLVNGRSLGTGTLEVGHTSASLEIAVSGLNGGMNTLTVRTEGEGLVYFDLSTRYDLLQSDVEAAGSIQVKRRYLDPKSDTEIKNFRAGQLVKVDVQINVPADAYYLAVEDHLPGSLEALNEGLNATNYVSADMWDYEDYQPFYWEDYGYNYKEIRGDRVIFFITSFKKGSHTFTYYARATTPGQFVALPTQVYAMYDLNLWGRSKSGSFDVGK